MCLKADTYDLDTDIIEGLVSKPPPGKRIIPSLFAAGVSQLCMSLPDTFTFWLVYIEQVAKRTVHFFSEFLVLGLAFFTTFFHKPNHRYKNKNKEIMND